MNKNVKELMAYIVARDDYGIMQQLAKTFPFKPEKSGTVREILSNHFAKLIRDDDDLLNLICASIDDMEIMITLMSTDDISEMMQIAINSKNKREG